MSNSSVPRVKRDKPPASKLKRHTYRKALPELRRDFEDRCAYSMQHLQRAGGLKAMEVDHLDPRKKSNYLQSYENLFLATRHCNGAKSDDWPTPAQQRKGLRFLNCCKEQDYGLHLFEDPNTHEIIWSSPAGGYHTIHCDLNAPHLVEERRQRSELRKLLDATPIEVVRPEPQLLACIEQLRSQLSYMISDIPPLPPRSASGST